MDSTITNRKKPHAATIPQTCELFGIHVKTGYSQAVAGTLPVPVFRSGRRVLVARQHLEELLGASAVASVLDRADAPEAAIAS